MAGAQEDKLAQAVQHLRGKRFQQAHELIQKLLATAPDFAQGWHVLGEIEHRCGRLTAAENAFRMVISLEPNNQRVRLALGILLKQGGRPAEAEFVFSEGFNLASDHRLKAAYAYNLGFAQYEQGNTETALANLDAARTFDPHNNAIDVSRAELLEELSRGDEAVALLRGVLARDPGNVPAHQSLNHLLYRQNRQEQFLKSYDAAPATAALQLSKATFLLKTNQAEAAFGLYSDVAAQDATNLEALMGMASALGQSGQHGQAVSLLERGIQNHPPNPVLHNQLAAAALQARDPQKAAAAAEQGLNLAPLDQHGLALLGSAWRIMGDQRDEFLNDYDELIRVFDLDPPEGFSDMAEFNAELEAWLVKMHPDKREPLHQSLRGGSQTRGAIFGAGHDLPERLRRRISDAVDWYITDTKMDIRHPFRARCGRGYRMTGSWSSRLGNCGYHVNHVHPMGWISSCYYVAVPDATKNTTSQQGWIKFGEPNFDIGLGIRQAVQPLAGRLVLFPSYMWHGTIPFHDANVRTTIAFDAVPLH